MVHGHWEGSCSLSIQSRSRRCCQSQCHTDCASSLICKTDGSSPDSTSVLSRCRRMGDKHGYLMLLLLRFDFLGKQHLTGGYKSTERLNAFPDVLQEVSHLQLSSRPVPQSSFAGADGADWGALSGPAPCFPWHPMV